jgi:hypothetical protein
MAFTSPNTATFKVNVAASPFTIKVTGIPTPTIKADSLPNGVAFADNKDGTATLSGTPTPGIEGDHTINITAHNGVASDVVQAFTLTVSH